jgi:hypothetical protein
MLYISSKSIRINSSRSCYKFHWLLALISSLTVRGGLTCFLHIGLNRTSLGSQFVFHILIDSLVPILLTRPCSKTFFMSRIARRTLDGEVPKLGSRKSQVGKYTALRTWALSDVGSCSMRQAWQAKRAMLNILISLKLNPHSSQVFWHCHLLPFYRACLLFAFLAASPRVTQSPSMCWHNPLGSRKHTMEYVGIACTMTLIKTFFPAERDCSIHP